MPVDYLIFRSMSKREDSDDPIEIVLLDVKIGNAGLNHVQKMNEVATAERRIRFDALRITESTQPNTREINSQQLKLSMNLVENTSGPREKGR